MEVQGTIKAIGKTEEISAKFKKRNVVVTTKEQYPQHISIQFVQDKCDMLDKYNVGEDVTVNINLRGREWTSPKGEVRYFNTIEGWRISKESEAVASGGGLEDESSDLPF